MRWIRLLTMLLPVTVALASCGGDEGRSASLAGTLTVYSGRSESLVGPLIERFRARSDIDVKVRYGDTAEMAAQILEEGDRSPADVFFGQDAGALGALEEAGRFAPLGQAILDRVPARFRSAGGRWVGTSGRVRVIAFNPTMVPENDVPDSVQDLTAARWRGKVGWAPTNGSFQIFITAFRGLRGEDAARTWLRDMKANGAVVYSNNDAIVKAVAAGETPLGLVNHYYPFELRAEDPDAEVTPHFLGGGDVGGLVNVAGAGILASSKNADAAARFVQMLLSEEGQRYFVEETFEYPLVPGIDAAASLPPLESLDAPALDLTTLADLRGTLDMLQEVGVL